MWWRPASRRKLWQRLADLIRREGVNAVLLTAGALIKALAFDLFLAPGHVAPGA